jgi:hypothetical protein
VSSARGVQRSPETIVYSALHRDNSWELAFMSWTVATYPPTYTCLVGIEVIDTKARMNLERMRRRGKFEAKFPCFMISKILCSCPDHRFLCVHNFGRLLEKQVRASLINSFESLGRCLHTNWLVHREL